MQEIWYENREYSIKMVNMLYGVGLKYNVMIKEEPKVKPSIRLILFRYGITQFRGF